MSKVMGRGSLSTRALLSGTAFLAICMVGQLAFDAVDAPASFIGTAHAQQQGLSGGGQGNGSGGTTGGVAGPKGSGAGGTTAGAGAGSGGQGTGTGPGGVNQNRFGGVPNQPPPPSGDDGTTTTTTTITNTTTETTGGGPGGETYLFGRADRCADFNNGRMQQRERLDGRNLERLNAAQYYLAPGFDPGGHPSSIYILANYQDEMGKANPDDDLAGTYLGLVATGPLTMKRVEEVNMLLCVTAAPKQIQAVIATAELQRKVAAARATRR